MGEGIPSVMRFILLLITHGEGANQIDCWLPLVEEDQFLCSANQIQAANIILYFSLSMLSAGFN